MKLLNLSDVKPLIGQLLTNFFYLIFKIPCYLYLVIFITKKRTVFFKITLQ